MGESKCTSSYANRLDCATSNNWPQPAAVTKVWTAADLCTQCAPIYLANMKGKCKDDSVELRCSKTSSCPLCRFLASIASDPRAEIDVGEIEVHLEVSYFSRVFWGKVTISCNEKGIAGNLMSNIFKDKWPDIGFSPRFDSSFGDDKLPDCTVRHLRPRWIDFKLLKGWLEYCKDHHSKTCNMLPGFPQRLSGLRVIDCETRAIFDAPETCEFAALSYVWGSSKAKKTGESARRGSLPSDIPQTIGDAIQAVLRLGLKYLWVDQYCIDQSNTAELQQQISAMDIIYNLATITIIAACGEDAFFGLPGVGSTPRTEQPAINLDGQVWVSWHEPPVKYIKRSKWYTRGWTYQEGVFSRRRFIFTEEQVYFECNCHRAQETLAYDMQKHYSNISSYSALFNRGFTDGKGEGLGEHIQKYTMRDLTFQVDAINALGGVFRAFAAMPSPVRHIWGIPADHYRTQSSCWPPNRAPIKSDVNNEFQSDNDSKLARALCWYLNEPAKRRDGFPSWSWAGWIGHLSHSYPWGFITHCSTRSDLKIWLQRQDGVYDRISETVIASANKYDASATIYNPVLRIEAWTLELRFEYIAEGFDETKTHFQNDNPNPTYFTSARFAATPHLEHWALCYWPPIHSDQVTEGDEIHGTCYWPLIHSIQVTEGDELHRELCEQQFDCILLSNQADFGLIVRKSGDFAERIGHIDINKEHLEIERPSNSPKDKLICHINDLIPSKRKTIVLK